jgi:glycosyltransferase involved in cell wall biosynthesis
LAATARERGLTNLTFTGYLSPDALVRLYHSSDVLFAQLRSSELHTLTAAPSKLLEYMAAARPIVYAGVAAPGDAAAILHAIETLTPEKRMLCGRRARAYVEQLPSRADEMRRFATIVAELR